MWEDREDVLKLAYALNIPVTELGEHLSALANPAGKSGKMPKQKPGQSKQDYGTPESFLEATRKKLGITDFDWDLAADAINTVTPNFYDEEANSLIQNWHSLAASWLWLNPPFADIYPWVEKCYKESVQGALIACLVPLSTAKWWVDYVDGKAYVLLLHGRLTFVGETKPYPKDCALLLYTPSGFKGYEVWSWKD